MRIVAFSLLLLGFAGPTQSVVDNAERSYFQIQNKAILASVAYELSTLLTKVNPSYQDAPVAMNPEYLDRAFRTHSTTSSGSRFASGVGYKAVPELIRDTALVEFDAELKLKGNRYEAYDKRTGNDLSIYEQKDWKTTNELALDSNQWRKEKGRLACEFDGGSDYGIKPYTTILFNVAYLKYQGQRLSYRNGKYELVSGAEPAIALSVDSLLSRNAIARVVCYQLLTTTSSMLAENFKKNGRTVQVDERGWSPLGYEDLNKYYVEKLGQWDSFAQKSCKTAIAFSKRDFEAIDTETSQKIAFPRDDDLLNEALKELNFYKEKCDFVNYFQIENYPMFLLAILRLYDVNLELDKTTNKYALAPGPTDAKKFFEIVAEFTFVDNKDDIEYLKKNLKSWKD